jgi:hypothetical protein
VFIAVVIIPVDPSFSLTACSSKIRFSIIIPSGISRKVLYAFRFPCVCCVPLSFDSSLYNCREPGSSVSILSSYGLDYRAIKIRSPAEAKDYSYSLCVQTGSGAHPASCPVGTGGPFPGAKARPGRDAVHSPPSSAEVENE